jgi:phosphatidylglycerophosphate synthase
MGQAVADGLRIIGENATRLWGMTSAERIRRIAEAHGKRGPALPPDRVIVADARFAFDPQWYAFVAAHEGTVLTLGGETVLANLPADGETGNAQRLAYEDGHTLYNHSLRKRERPFLDRLEPGTVARLERQSYYAAYKGVTDLLTKYLWPEAALQLTRLAARLRLTPNMVTAVGIALCIAATLLFWEGHYWWGMAAGFIFMVLDTVDGKLARCTLTSSSLGNVLDHGIDLVHPPFWWWAWAHGLSTWGLAYSPGHMALVIGTIVGGYVVQRLIEGAFIKLFGMHIHVWERTDSRFRLITARRNPNMVILFFSLLAQRPDIGLDLVALWTVLSCVFHAVRLLQAMARHRRKGPLQSWLAAGEAQA